MVTAEAGNGSITLNWKKIANAVSYTVSQGDSTGDTVNSFTPLDRTTDAITYTVESLTNDWQYHFQVSAVNSTGETKTSKTASATPRPPLPATPKNVVATAGNGKATLSWDMADHAYSYVIYQDDVSIDNTTENRYTATELVNGTEYSFAIAAVNSSGESEKSDVATATPLQTPHNIRLSAYYQGIDLSWDGSGDSFRVHWATEPLNTLDGNYSLARDHSQDSVSDNAISIRDLTNDATYYIVIIAVVNGEDSLASEQASATPPSEQVLGGHTHNVRSVAFHPDGRYIASASDDSTIRLWKRQDNGDYTADAVFAPSTFMKTVAFRADGLLASGGNDNRVRLWREVNGDYTADGVLSGHSKSVYSVAFRADGLLASGGGNTVIIWQRDGDDYTDDSPQALSGHTLDVRSVAFATDGALASGNTDLTIRIWRENNGSYSHADTITSTDEVTALAISPQGELAFYQQTGNTVQLWDIADASKIADLYIDSNRVIASLAFSADGLLAIGEKHGLAGGERAIRAIRLWKKDNDGNYREDKALLGHTAPVNSVVFSRDGNYLVSGAGIIESASTIRVWKIR